MTRRQLDSKARRKQRRAQVAVDLFERTNGLGTEYHLIQCERCARKHIGGESSPIKDRPCYCGNEIARYV